MKEIRKNCISVIVAIYNMENYLDRCIQSILCQTYENLEILLVDDGSTDSSGAICEKYQERDSRIVWSHKENGGVSDARNYGIAKAHGEFMAFVDPDDWIEEDFFENLMAQIKESKADIVCVGFDYVNESGSWMPDHRIKNIKMTQKQCLRRLCENKCFTSHLWNKLYRRRVFENIRFPYGENYEDISVMHELVKNAGEIVCSDKILYHYFMRSESIIHVKSVKNEMDNFRAYCRRLKAVEGIYLKYRVLKCCAWSGYHILFLSNNQFDKKDYEEVLHFWKGNKQICFLGIKYFLFYLFPEFYKRHLI
ncbi:MAG: glycosyltransferase [Lachnospiraceae bacterium]|nr:glycosyltransferase [Lachnospiraceae bacterium]